MSSMTERGRIADSRTSNYEFLDYIFVVSREKVYINLPMRSISVDAVAGVGAPSKRYTHGFNILR